MRFENRPTIVRRDLLLDDAQRAFEHDALDLGRLLDFADGVRVVEDVLPVDRRRGEVGGLRIVDFRLSNLRFQKRRLQLAAKRPLDPVP